jgi:hypothetical protein
MTCDMTRWSDWLGSETGAAEATGGARHPTTTRHPTTARQPTTTRHPTTTRQQASEEGSAIVEFLGVGLLLLIPLIYLILTLGELQAATFAVHGGAREAARMLVTAPNVEQGVADAQAAVDLALADQGFSGGTLHLSCATNDCFVAGGTVVIEVGLDVPLPWMPDFVQGAVPLVIPVSATYPVAIDNLAARP